MKSRLMDLEGFASEVFICFNIRLHACLFKGRDHREHIKADCYLVK